MSLKIRLQTMQSWAKTHSALTALLGLVVGTGIGIALPVWQTYWVESPKLTIEIYAIERQVSADARIPSDDDALAVFVRDGRPLEDFLVLDGANPMTFLRASAGSRQLGPLSGPRTREYTGYTPDEVADLLALAKSELRALPERIEERERALRDIQSLTPERLNAADVDRLNAPIANEFEPTEAFTLGSAAGLAERQRAVDHFKIEYAKRLEAVQKRYAELQAQLPAAERRLDEMKKDIETKKGFFQITAILNNSGRKSTSIRHLGLFRVYIGKGNYVDLKLTLKDYEKNAQVEANGTRLAVFTSDLIEALPESDRSLATTYWGQSVHGILFLEDVTGAIHASNPISFAKGLYIKEVFDRLTTEAASAKYLQPRN